MYHGKQNITQKINIYFKKYWLYLIVFLFVFLFVYKKYEQNQLSKNEKPIEKKGLNMIVVLDLSDRICKDREFDQMQKDTSLIFSLIELLKEDMASDMIVNSSSSFHLIVAEQDRGTKTNLNNLDFPTKKYGRDPEGFKQFENGFKVEIRKIYSQFENKKRNDFKGAKMWDAFDKDVRDILDPNLDNRVIVISDGYFDCEKPCNHKNEVGFKLTTSDFLNELVNTKDKEYLKKYFADSSSYGLIPLDPMPKFQCLVWGLNPQPEHKFNPEIELMIKMMWTQWFNRMGNEVSFISMKTPTDRSENQIYSFFKSGRN